jgi:thymidylate kinase
MIENSGCLISLSGIDGSGKSTIALALQDHLKKRYDVDCRVIWCKFGNSPLNNPRLIHLVKRLLAANEKPNQVPEEHQTNNSGTHVHRIYRNLLWLNHSIEIFTCISVPLIQSQTVICDRYIFDSMVDLQQELGLNRQRAEEMFSGHLIPKPNYKFLLDLPAEYALHRKTDTESEGYLIERRRMYLEIAQSCGLHIIDSTQAFETVLHQVLEFTGFNNLIGNTT